ncbi:MAG: DUF969 domain-containing protein [Proteobacteria bacterium]|nr:DUF969 domain-containing protein [Pseudomonadota bacterium]
MLVLLGLGVMLAGFALRWNPLAVIVLAALASGWAAGIAPLALIAALGKAFNSARYVMILWLLLPVIGLLEAYGLQEHARALIERLRGATVGRLLTGYLLIRQVSAALGLDAAAGQAQTVRPLLAPMAEAAAERQAPGLDQPARDAIKAMAAATDNVGRFFGEDIFLAVGSILLMKGVLDKAGIVLEPWQFSVWAIPSALAAFAIHGWRLRRLDRALAARGEGGA